MPPSPKRVFPHLLGKAGKLRGGPITGSRGERPAIFSSKAVSILSISGGMLGESERLGGNPPLVPTKQGRLSVKPPVICLVEFKQDDTTIERNRIEHNGQSSSYVMRIGPANPRPDGRFIGFGPLDGVRDEDGIVGHFLKKRGRMITRGQAY
jgi:hypothetical protein